jgi:hypothetical protein
MDNSNDDKVLYILELLLINGSDDDYHEINHILGVFDDKQKAYDAIANNRKQKKPKMDNIYYTIRKRTLNEELNKNKEEKIQSYQSDWNGIIQIFEEVD